MKKGFSKIVVCIMVLALAISVAACASSTAAVVEIGEDQVDTIYSVVGEKKITGTSSSADQSKKVKELTYASGAISQDEMQQYITALEQQGFAQITETVTQETAQALALATESVTPGYLVVLNIYFDPQGSSVLTYTVAEGTLDRS